MNVARPRLIYRLIGWASPLFVGTVERVGPEKARRGMTSSARLPAAIMGQHFELQEVADEQVAGVPIRRYRPAAAQPGVVVFIHGGGWVLGDLNTYDRTARTLAAKTAREVVSVDYRRAPEARYPAALDDCVAVVRSLAAQGPVAVVGDSAGGNLAAAVAQVVPVAAQVLLYPVTDTANEHPSYERFRDGPLLTAAMMRYFRETYVPSHEQRLQSGASPLLAAHVSHVAPAYVVVAECDVLHDEGVAYAERLQAAGVDTTLDEVPGTIHGFMTLLGLPEARHAMDRTTAWLNQRL